MDDIILHNVVEFNTNSDTGQYFTIGSLRNGQYDGIWKCGVITQSGTGFKLFSQGTKHWNNGIILYSESHVDTYTTVTEEYVGDTMTFSSTVTKKKTLKNSYSFTKKIELYCDIITKHVIESAVVTKSYLHSLLTSDFIKSEIVNKTTDEIITQEMSENGKTRAISHTFNASDPDKKIVHYTEQLDHWLYGCGFYKLSIPSKVHSYILRYIESNKFLKDLVVTHSITENKMYKIEVSAATSFAKLTINNRTAVSSDDTGIEEYTIIDFNTDWNNMRPPMSVSVVKKYRYKGTRIGISTSYDVRHNSGKPDLKSKKEWFSFGNRKLPLDEVGITDNSEIDESLLAYMKLKYK